MFTKACPEENCALASFGLVSVVMMARAKRSAAVLVVSRPPASSTRVEMILSTGNGTPMMPVDEGNTVLGTTPRNRPSSWQIRWHALNPALPVAQLALPEFTITARTWPRLAAKDARPTSRGAATTRFLVKTAAAVVPAQASTSARSGRPLALIPAQAAEKLKPAGKWILFVD